MTAPGTPACAAPPTGNTVHKGKATFYDSAGSGGNCSFPSPPADRLYVALGPSEYAGAAACGGYLDVSGPKGQGPGAAGDDGEGNAPVGGGGRPGWTLEVLPR